MTRARLTLALALASALALGAACGGRRGPASKDPTRELGKLREDLYRYRFKSTSARALERAVALARRSSGPEAALVWSQVSSSRLDWALMALLRQRPALLAGLVRHLGLPSDCAQGARLAVHCISPMARGIAAGYEKARAIYDAESDANEAARARRRVDLVHQVLLHERLASPEAAEALRGALGDEAYDVKRYAQLWVTGQWLGKRATRSGGPLSGPRELARAFPYPCPRAFARLGRATPAQLEQDLARCNCAMGCSDPRTGTSRGCKEVASPFAPLTPNHATPHAAAAVHALRLLSRVALDLKPKRYLGLQRVFRTQLNTFREAVAQLAVRLPYRQVLQLGTARVVEPPSHPAPLPEAWELRAAVHVVVSDGQVLIGLAPVLALTDGRITLLGADAGYRLPGRRVTVSGSRHALRQALDKARAAANGKLRLGATGDGVALYVDQATPMREVARWVQRLHQARAATVELVFGDGHTAGRSIRASWVEKPRDGAAQSLRKLDAKLTFGAWTAQRLLAAARTPATPPATTFAP